MQEVLRFLAANLDVISLVLAALGVILAVVFYYRSTNVKEPTYSRNGVNLVTPKLTQESSIRVTFQDKPVDTLSLAYVAFWNGGRATISHDDVAEADPLRIVASDGCEILAAEVVSCNKPANKFRVTMNRNENSVGVDFDFVDRMNGLVMRLYHTGQDSRLISVRGTVKGANDIYNADKATDVVSGVFGKLEDRLEEPRFLLGVFRIIPEPMQRMMVDARQIFPFYLLVMLALTALVGPFLLVYVLAHMVAAITVFLVTIPYAMFVSWRHRMPRELYPIMRSPMSR